MIVPGKRGVRIGALLLMAVACFKPSEGGAAGGGNSTPPAKQSGPAPAAAAGGEPAPAMTNAALPGTATAAASGQVAQDVGNAAAPTPASAGELVEAQVLIWGGGRTPEEGRKALERFEAERSGLEAILSLGEGYPRVIASDTVPGLKPGFHVVVLGACKPEEAQEPIETLQSFKPGVYARTVKFALEPGSCPKHENGMWGAGTERLKEEPFELTAAAFIGVESGPSSVPWLVRLYLRDEKGDLIAQTGVDPRDSEWADPNRYDCRPSIEAGKTVMRVTVACNTLAGSPWQKKLKIQITAGKIEWLSSPY